MLAPRHVTWADLHRHPATDLHLAQVNKDLGVRSDIIKRNSSATANTEESPVENILIMCCLDTREEHPTLVANADNSKSEMAPVGETTTENRTMGEPINGDIGQPTDVTGNSDNYTNPSPRKLFEDFLLLVRDVRARSGKSRRKTKFLRSMGKHRLAAVREARLVRKVEGQRGRAGVANPSILRQKVQLGLTLHRLLTDTSGRAYTGHNIPVVSSHLTPNPCKRRQLIGAAWRLQQEVAQGKALALEVLFTKEPTESDEHLNLVRDYQVDLHTKLMKPEENRAHMTSYIHFEEDALGDDGILGEQDTDYFRDLYDDF